jgi:hypothetical protein
MLWQVLATKRLNRFLPNMTNLMKVVDFVIQLTVSVQELAQDTAVRGSTKLSTV